MLGVVAQAFYHSYLLGRELEDHGLSPGKKLADTIKPGIVVHTCDPDCVQALHRRGTVWFHMKNN
jgi:hypothetical protein